MRNGRNEDVSPAVPDKTGGSMPLATSTTQSRTVDDPLSQLEDEYAGPHAGARPQKAPQTPKPTPSFLLGLTRMGYGSQGDLDKVYATLPDNESGRRLVQAFFDGPVHHGWPVRTPKHAKTDREVIEDLSFVCDLDLFCSLDTLSYRHAIDPAWVALYLMVSSIPHSQPR